MSHGRSQKQVYELTLEDLRRHPVWEFKREEGGARPQDESTVQPHKNSGPLDPAERMFVVRAHFTLADGTILQGYLTPPVRGREGLDSLQPIIVTEHGQVRFWCGTAVPDAKRLSRSYAFLGKLAGQVFPVRFESGVELAGGPARGSLPGFLVLEDFQSRRTRTIH